jgi:hypothetical protein
MVKLNMTKPKIDPALKETGGLVPVQVGGERGTIVMMKPGSVYENLASATDKAVKPLVIEKGEQVSKHERDTVPPINK